MVFEVDTNALAYASNDLSETGTSLSTATLARLRSVGASVTSAMGSVGNDVSRRIDTCIRALEVESMALTDMADALASIASAYERCEEEAGLAHKQMTARGQGTEQPQREGSASSPPPGDVLPHHEGEHSGRLAMEPQMFQGVQDMAALAAVTELFETMF